MGQAYKFWDRHAKRYAKSPVADEASYQHKLKVTREYLRTDMEVLEFGCGTGSTALLHAPFVKHIHATDVSPKMIEIAQAKSDARQVTNVDFEVATLDEIDKPDEIYDAVLGLNILHLVDDRDAAIDRVRTLLKPGGVFVSSTACLDETMKCFKVIGPVGKFFGLLPTIRVFTVQDLVSSITRGGFEIEHQWQPGKGKAVFIVARKPG